MDIKISSILGQIERLSKLSSKVKEQIENLLEELEIQTELDGLNSDQVTRCYTIVFSGHSISTHSISLLNTILPREPINSSQVLQIISTLGSSSHKKSLHDGRIDYKVQKKSLEGLISLIEIGAISREGLETLSNSWIIVERCLIYSSLRETIAQLLYLITNRSHVQPHRVKSLETLISSLETPPSSLLNLLTLYKSFYPKLISTLPTFLNLNFIKGECIDKITERRGWNAKALKVLKVNSVQDEGEESTPLSDLARYEQLLSNINQGSNLSPHEILNSVMGNSIKEKNFFPVKSISDRLKVWDLILRSGYEGDGEHLHRLNHHINSNLMYGVLSIDSTPESEAEINDILCRTRELCEVGGELMSEFEPILHDYLQVWDGETNKEVIFDLIALQKPLPYHIFYQTILQPLQRLAGSASPLWLADLFVCFTDLFNNLAIRDDWHLIPGDERVLTTVFGSLKEEVSYTRSVQEILEQIDRIINVSALIYPQSVVLRSAALSFYEMTLTLPMRHGLAIIRIPATPFAFSCLLSNELMSVSRICGIVAKIRRAMTTEPSAIRKDFSGTAELTPLLNNDIVEFVNTIWMKRFLQGGDLLELSEEDVETIRTMCEARNQLVATSQGLTVHNAFSNLARDYLNEWAQEVGLDLSNFNTTITYTSHKELVLSGDNIAPTSFTDFRVRFLDYLKTRGAIGIEEFLFSSLQSLIDRREREAGNDL